jgi:cation-transporting ATPase E
MEELSRNVNIEENKPAVAEELLVDESAVAQFREEKKHGFFRRGEYLPMEQLEEEIEADLLELSREDEVATKLVGLSSQEVSERVREGKVNIAKDKSGKSYFGIIRENLFTFFNMVWAIVALVLIMVDSYSNLSFLAVVSANLLIAIIQESRAKAAVEKLSVTTEPIATVIRDGLPTDIPADAVVIDDLMRVELGRQILCDGIVVSGICEVNESMLTGESIPVKKTWGSRLLAGSFVVSGSAYAKVDRVGKDNYIHRIEKEARSFKKPSSNLFLDLNRLIKIIGIILVPMATLLGLMNWVFYRGSYEGFDLLRQIVERTSGSIIGMIPAGIYLLVTLTLSLSVITLSKKSTLVQDMYSIEMLASADVICLDKTGTITDGTMKVCGLESLDGTPREELRRILGLVESTDEGLNATSKALVTEFGRTPATVTDFVPFSSQRKFSAVAIEGEGVFAIGAPHFVPCPISEELESRISDHAKRGERVLLLARLPEINLHGEAIALIAIEDRIRPNAKEIIEKFQSQDVTIKVISGDHAETVSAIAKKVGIIGAENYLSCEELSDEELIERAESAVVFGRVTPEQKVLLVKTLKSKGHTVAMTGDGVNDTLALKEANCAIAMADGSEMARKVSQIVLMKSDFGTLPDVVREGRRCINNVRQSAALYLMKTIFSILLSIFTIITAQGYPFAPNNFLLVELFVIGLASVLLALEPNDNRIEGSFLKTVMLRSVPSALALFIPTVTCLIVCMFSSSITDATRNAVAMCLVILAGFINLFFICTPFTKWRVGVLALIGILLGFGTLFGAYLDSVSAGNQIFGFMDAFKNPAFLITMLSVTFVLSIALNLFRKRVEGFVAGLGTKKVSLKLPGVINKRRG